MGSAAWWRDLCRLRSLRSSARSTRAGGAVQFVYLVFGIINGLLLIRLVLKLLGANPQAAFSNWIYKVTNFFLAPFHNILPTIGNAQSQLEMSTVLAILVYSLAALAIARLVSIILYRNITVSRRSSTGLRPRGY